MLPPESQTPIDRARAHVDASVRVHERVREQARTLVHIAMAICDALETGGRVRFFDGSAGGDARRWVADLSPHVPTSRAHQLVGPSGATTASVPPAQRFGRVVEAPDSSGQDVAVGIAIGPVVGGVLHELQRASAEGATAVVFGGKQIEDGASFCDRAVVIPSEDGARVHEALVLCRHIVVDLIAQSVTKHTSVSDG
jgi:phosphoheptose isomerase